MTALISATRLAKKAALGLVCMVLGAACAGPMDSGENMLAPWGVPTVHETLDSGVVTRVPFGAANSCSGSFVSHELENISLTVPGQVVRMFDSNGSGVALGDLNGNYLLDIALANLSEPNAILWNQGEQGFLRMDLPNLSSRAVAIVDVDGDTALDVVFTQRLGPPIVYLSKANTDSNWPRSFSEAAIPGITKTAYSMAWGDTDRDGDLDMVTGSYDLELQMLLEEAFKGQTDSGAYWHENQDFQFSSQLLTRQSQALAIAVGELQKDGRPLIIMGNDFLLPDRSWIWDQGQWQEHQPFDVTTQNTMSFSIGDVNNDGRLDFFAADMGPRDKDPETMSAWQPIANKVLEDPDDLQIVQNVLNLQGGESSFQNLAQESGVAATGWTWSTQMADFDQDGFLDLYVVNGMNALDLFSHLPDNELVETNWAFHNVEGNHFALAPEWNMGLPQGGRGMTVGDVDFDGDLDVIVNNLLEAAILLENQLCQGSSIQVRMRDLRSSNTHGVGARLTLYLNDGMQVRVLEVSSGYLSGLPPIVHFGFPLNSTLGRMEVLWPDGELEIIHEILPQHLYTVVRTIEED